MSDKKSFWDKLQSVDRRILYVILVVATSLPFLWTYTIPVDPDPSSKDFYAAVTAVPADKTMFIQSDWTNSTRGESAGHMEALYRILMAKGQKFVIFGLADAQSPQVYRNALMRVNLEREKAGLPTYKPWVDYIDLGFFPNAEGTSVSMANDIRKIFGTRRVKDDKGVERNVFESPPLQNVKKIGDAGMMTVITASASIDVAVQRLSDKVTMTCMCTGVIGPTALTFYQSGQLKGVAVGLKGVYDVEYMMKNGLNVPGPDGKVAVTFPQKSEVSAEPMPADKVVGVNRGGRYYLSLHAALILVILFVVLGNVGMFASRGRKGAKR
jgi:hypothetical protein